MYAIEAEGLRKTYPGGVEAVKGIDFEVSEGEVFGLLGPNGAGKSTTVGMLTTTIVPTAGTARLAGHDVARSPLLARSVSSVVFQEAVVDRGLTGRANLELHTRLWGVSRATGQAPDQRADRGARAVRADRPARSQLQRRRAPAPRDRPRAVLGAPGAVPRRADGRARPEDPPRAARRDRRPARPRRPDDPGHDPLPRRGPASVRPRGDHPRGRARRARQPQGAARRARPRDPRVPRRRERRSGRSQPCGTEESPPTTRSRSARGSRSRSTTTRRREALAAIESERLRASEIATRVPNLDDVYLQLTGGALREAA